MTYLKPYCYQVMELGFKPSPLGSGAHSHNHYSVSTFWAYYAHIHEN